MNETSPTLPTPRVRSSESSTGLRARLPDLDAAVYTGLGAMTEAAIERAFAQARTRCLGCSHLPHNAGECSVRPLFTTEPVCRCDWDQR